MKKKSKKFYTIFNFKFKWSYYILIFLIVNVFYFSFIYDHPKSKPYTKHELRFYPKSIIFENDTFLDLISDYQILIDFENNYTSNQKPIDLNKIYGKIFLENLSNLFVNNNFVKTEKFEMFKYDAYILLIKKVYSKKIETSKKLYFTKNVEIIANEAQEKTNKDIYKILFLMHSKLKENKLDFTSFEKNKFYEIFYKKKLNSIYYDYIFYDDNKLKDIQINFLKIFIINIVIFILYYKLNKIFIFYTNKIKIN
jgi:hypothetical protein